MTHYEIISLPALSLAQYTDRITSQTETGEVVGSLFSRLLASMQQLGLDPEQPTVAWYAGGDTDAELGVGVPVTGSLDAGDTGLEDGALPAAERAVVTRHKGTLDGLAPAWQALHQHLAAQGLHPSGPCREVYVAGDVSREDAWVVDLQQPVA